MAAQPDRRNVKRRAQLLQRVIAEVVQGSLTTLTLDSLELRLGLARDAAERIIRRLVSAGVLQEVRRGMWARRGWAAAHQTS